MPSTTIISGVILILIGIAGFVFSDLELAKRLTAMIPAAFGIILVALGSAAKAKESARKHLMHAAVLVGLIGFIIATGRLLSKYSELTVSLSSIVIGLMALVCLFYVILSIQSFMKARKDRV